jgi:MerR family transcriptional regulator, light-induced transcriptional regulator
MDRRDTKFDKDLFAHVSKLFAQKGQVLPSDTLEQFARDVVARVSERVVRHPAGDASSIPAHDVAAFCDLLQMPDQPRVALDFIAARRAEGASLEDVYLEYIGGAARLLGERWEDDRMTPLQVTVCAGTLYALMRALRATELADHRFDSRRMALLATVPGERHGVGITVAADMFRKAGWDIDLQIGLDHHRLLDRVQKTQPGIIGLSLSSSDRLPDLLKTIVALRLASNHAFIGVAPGGDLTADEIRSFADVDIVFADALGAIEALDAVVAARQGL